MLGEVGEECHERFCPAPVVAPPPARSRDDAAGFREVVAAPDVGGGDREGPPPSFRLVGIKTDLDQSFGEVFNPTEKNIFGFNCDFSIRIR